MRRTGAAVLLCLALLAGCAQRVSAVPDAQDGAASRRLLQSNSSSLFPLLTGGFNTTTFFNNLLSGFNVSSSPSLGVLSLVDSTFKAAQSQPLNNLLKNATFNNVVSDLLAQSAQAQAEYFTKLQQDFASGSAGNKTADFFCKLYGFGRLSNDMYTTFVTSNPVAASALAGGVGSFLSSVYNSVTPNVLGYFDDSCAPYTNKYGDSLTAYIKAIFGNGTVADQMVAWAKPLDQYYQLQRAAATSPVSAMFQSAINFISGLAGIKSPPPPPPPTSIANRAFTNFVSTLVQGLSSARNATSSGK